MKVALIGAVAILVAVIISSCGTTPQPMPTSTPALSPTSTAPPEPLLIFAGDRLATGYNMGVNTSGGLIHWVTVKSGKICMAYPGGQRWGAVFITVGKPTQPPRPGEDLSSYYQLSLELYGQAGGESMSIGMKDNTAPDNGTETKVPVYDLTKGWNKFSFPLSQFTGTDLHKLYVVIEFVFAGTAATVCARNIQYLTCVCSQYSISAQKNLQIYQALSMSEAQHKRIYKSSEKFL